MIGGPVPSGLKKQIDDLIEATPFPDHVLDARTGGRRPRLVIKYIPPKFGAVYRMPGQKLHISSTVGFTWGTATYVSPLAFPKSTAIFGRVGVVAQFDPQSDPADPKPRPWRIFDATVAANQQLYVDWLQSRPLYREFILTAQSGYFGQQLRDQFRQEFRIDCVLFRPDQSHPRYTDTASDIWMAVTDWAPDGSIATGYSDRFMMPRLVALVEEEFEDKRGGTHRGGLLNLSTPPPKSDLCADLHDAYYNHDIIRIPS